MEKIEARSISGTGGDGTGLLDALSANRLWFAALLFMSGVVYHRVVYYMALEWYTDSNFSHGFIVPVISGYFAYLRWDELKDARTRPWNAGLAVILFGLLMLLAGFAATEFFTMRSSLIVVLAGMVMFLFGKKVMKLLLLPVGYLFLMVPIPYVLYDTVAFPLKLFIAKYSVLILKAVGIAVWREGNIISFPNLDLEVADACSGVRSLLSLLALGVAFAVFSQKSAAKRVVLVLSAIPVAILANGARVVSTGILAQYMGERAAQGFFHEFAGLAVFALAVAMLIGIGMLLRRIGNDT